MIAVCAVSQFTRIFRAYVVVIFTDGFFEREYLGTCKTY
jgi:hypothetical protein